MMKKYIFKGITSAALTSIIFLILSVIVCILLDKGYFVYNKLELFRLNVISVPIIVISSNIEQKHICM